ncbi:MAG: hypothetical protein DMF70_01285, partial [Acidobacteria bacterium]
IPGGRFTVRENGNVGIGSVPIFQDFSRDNPLAKLEILGGRDKDGNGSGADAIAFSFTTGGGFRHWIRTRHNGLGIAGNAIDFFTNSSSRPEESSAPGVGSQLVLTLDGGNVGIGTASPKSTLHVFKSALGADTVGGNLILNRFYDGSWRGASLFSYYPTAHGHDVLAFGVSESATAPNSIAAVKWWSALMVMSASARTVRTTR